MGIIRDWWRRATLDRAMADEHAAGAELNAAEAARAASARENCGVASASTIIRVDVAQRRYADARARRLALTQ